MYKPRKQGEPLEPRQISFCHEYIIDHNATQAAIRAGYGARSKNVVDVAKVAGYELLKLDNVKLLVKQLEQETAKKLDITKEGIAAELDEAKQRAIDAGNIQAEIRAVELKGKLVGAFTEVVDHTHHISPEMVESMNRVLEDE